MIMADWRFGTQKIFRGIQEVSAGRVCKEKLNHNLYLFALPPKVDYNPVYTAQTKPGSSRVKTNQGCVYTTLF